MVDKAVCKECVLFHHNAGFYQPNLMGPVLPELRGLVLWQGMALYPGWQNSSAIPAAAAKVKHKLLALASFIS